jgi:hypothetical protein
MKKWIFAVMSLMLTTPALAQYGRPHVHRLPAPPAPRSSYHYSTDAYYGLRLGVGFATVNSDDSRLDGGSMKAGLNAGVVAGFQLGHYSPIYFETGLSYVEKGGEGHYEGSKFTYGLNYLEMPLLIKGFVDITPNFSVQPFAGGYVAVGVSGKIKDFGHRQAYSSFDSEGFNRFDGGIKAGCGVQYEFLYGEIGYDFGLANISHDYFDTSHTGMLYTTIGVNF